MNMLYYNFQNGVVEARRWRCCSNVNMLVGGFAVTQIYDGIKVVNILADAGAVPARSTIWACNRFDVGYAR